MYENAETKTVGAWENSPQSTMRSSEKLDNPVNKTPQGRKRDPEKTAERLLKNFLEIGHNSELIDLFFVQLLKELFS